MNRSSLPKSKWATFSGWCQKRRTPKLFLLWSVHPFIELAHSLAYLLSLGFFFSQWGLEWLLLIVKEEGRVSGKSVSDILSAKMKSKNG